MADQNRDKIKEHIYYWYFPEEEALFDAQVEQELENGFDVCIYMDIMAGPYGTKWFLANDGRLFAYHFDEQSFPSETEQETVTEDYSPTGNLSAETADQSSEVTAFRPLPPPPKAEPLSYAVMVSAELDYSTWTEQPKKRFYPSSSGGTSAVVEGEYEYSATVTVHLHNIGEHDLHDIELEYFTYVEEAVTVGITGYHHVITANVSAGDLPAGETKSVELNEFPLEWGYAPDYKLFGQIRLYCDQTKDCGVFAHLFWQRDATVSEGDIVKWTGSL